MTRALKEWSVLISPKRRLQREVSRANEARDRGEWEVAAERYRVALRLAPNKANLWMQAAHARKEAGDLEGAKAAYAQVERLAPADIDTQVQLGHFYKQLGEAERALRYYRAAVDGGSTDEHARHFLAVNGFGRVDQGERQDTALDKADAARDAGMFERAAHLYREAAQADPRSPLFVQVGNSLKEAGSLFAAEKAYMSALELDPDDADCLLQLGHLMKVMGDRGRARIYFERSARLDPDRSDAEVELAAMRNEPPGPDANGVSAEGLPQAPRTPVIVGTAAAILRNIKFAQTQRRC